MLALVAPVRAQDQYVFFGDSLTDSENSAIFTELLLGAESPQSPPYFDGRFSNGPNWSDRIAPDQATYAGYLFSDPACPDDPITAAACDPALDPGVLPGVSLGFAFGGSRSGAQVLLDAPGFLTALDDFVGYANAGRLDDTRDATFVVWTGGNDYSNYVVDNGGLTETEIVEQTIGNIETGLGQIAVLGAERAVLFNIFDLSVIPNFVTTLGPDGAAQAGELAASHNETLAGRMDAIRQETGLDVVLVDVAALYRDIYGTPGSYGFDNLTVGCIDEDTLGPTGACPDAAAERAALYWDGTHPTTAAHDFIAQLFTSTIRTVDQAGGQLAVLADAPLRQAEIVSRGIGGNLDAWRTESARTPATSTQLASAGPVAIGHPTRGDGGEFGIFAVAAGQTGRRAGEAGIAGYRQDGAGGIVGIDYRPSETAMPLIFGVHAGFLELDADIDGDANIENSSLVAGAFAGARFGRATLTGQITAMQIDVGDAQRETGFDVHPTARGETEGWALTGEVVASIDLPISIGGRTVWASPSARVQAGTARIDGYQEHDAAFLDLTVDETRQTEVRGGIGMGLWSRFEPAGWGLTTFASARWDTDLMRPRREGGARLSSGQQVETVDEGESRQTVSLDAGVQIDLPGAVSLQGAAAAIIDLDENDTVYLARFGVAKRF